MEHKPLDLARAPIIKQLFEMAATGDWSLSDLARWAAEQGFTMTPMRRRRTEEEILAEEEDDARLEIEKIARAPAFTTIHKIISNPFYAGKVPGNDGKWVQSSSHEAIISEELFDKTQEVLRKKYKGAHYIQFLDHPLRGIVHCGVCGRVYSFRYRADSIAPIQNKVGAFLADPLMRRMLTEPKRALHFRRIMDRREILLVNLAHGKIGEDSASLLGSLLVTTIGLAAFSRADAPEIERQDFILYMDEFQNFTTLSIATMISELRKYHVGLVLANQHLSQLEQGVRDAVLGNIGTLIAFRVGPQDAVLLGRELVDRFEPIDLMNLPNHHIYLRLMIDGAPSRPFSATTMLPLVQSHHGLFLLKTSQG